MASPLDPLYNTLTQLRAEWPKRGWSWDSRFSCVASSFDMDVADRAREAVMHAFPAMWTDRTFAEAPPALREVGERTGGVRGGQLLYSCTPSHNVYAYGLWWPWGDGRTISLRVGLEGTIDYSTKLAALFGTER